MDYKKIFKSKQLRQKIMRYLSFVPDKTMLKIQYRMKFNRPLNLKNPQRYSEKIQLYKLYYRNPVLGRCVDKYEVRNYVKEKGTNVEFPELYGVFFKAEDIDFDKFPQKFVIKTNDGGGGDNIIICPDKNKLDVSQSIKALNSWLNKKKNNAGREWAYTQIKKSLIIVEELLENKEAPERGLEDFKFYCFNGEPYCVAHDGDRYIRHRRNFYDLEWNNLHIGSDYENYENDAPKPQNLDRMIEVARELSKDFPHVRVDLYSVEGKVYFGELTFYPLCGYVQFTPDEFDFRLGKLFDTTSFC